MRRLALLALLCPLACAMDPNDPNATGVDGKADTAGTTYQDVFDYANDTGQVDQWLGVVRQLSTDFDNICGDTFCGSDYSDLRALDLRCSINGKGVLKNCTYVFAGSYSTVSATYGTIKTTAKTFSCHVPVSGIKLSDFMATLTATSFTPALQRPLPGSTKSIYDSLGGCLP